jgi:hypothetical protein
LIAVSWGASSFFPLLLLGDIFSCYEGGSLALFSWEKKMNRFTLDLTGLIFVALLFGNVQGAEQFTYSIFDPPESQYTNLYAIDDNGRILGWYAGIDSHRHGFLYDKGTYTPIMFPGATDTSPIDINSLGEIIGSVTISNEPHGFVATPIPEPSTLALLGMGAISLLAYAWRRRNRIDSLVT